MSRAADRPRCFLGFASDASLPPASFSVYKPWAIIHPFLTWQNAFGGCADGLGMKSTRGFALRRDLHVNAIISRLPQTPRHVSGVTGPAAGCGELCALSNGLSTWVCIWHPSNSCLSPGLQRLRGSWTALFTLLYISSFMVKCSLPQGWPWTSKVKSLCNSKQLNWYGNE